MRETMYDDWISTWDRISIIVSVGFSMAPLGFFADRSRCARLTFLRGALWNMRNITTRCEPLTAGTCTRRTGVSIDEIAPRERHGPSRRRSISRMRYTWIGQISSTDSEPRWVTNRSRSGLSLTDTDASSRLQPEEYRGVHATVLSAALWYPSLPNRFVIFHRFGGGPVSPQLMLATACVPWLERDFYDARRRRHGIPRRKEVVAHVGNWPRACCAWRWKWGLETGVRWVGDL